MKKKVLFIPLLAMVLSGCSFNFDNLMFWKKKPEHEHTYATVWSSDANQHWHTSTCEHKDLRIDVSDHVDANDDGKCDICHHTMSVAPLKVTITVVNGTGSGEYEVGSQVTVTAKVTEGYEFQEWQINGTKVSENSSYTFTATTSLSIVAILVPKDEHPMAKYAKTLVMTGDSFKVLNLTDSQLTDNDDFECVKHIFDTLVQREQPDLITLLGDILNDDPTYGVEQNARKTVELLDSYGIPWAPIFGNHDNLEYQAGYTSMKTGGVPFLMNLFSECENCLFVEGPEEIQGKSNYMVNVVNTNGDMVESFVFLDSFTNGLQETNVDFYEDCIEYAKELNDGQVVPSVMFDHIPILEYTDAYHIALDNECRTLVGNSGNEPLSAGTDKMFAKIKELGSTTSIICGHDHESAFVTKYDGVNFAYAMKSTLGDNKEDNNNSHPLGGLMLEVGNGSDELRYSKVEDITYELKVGNHLAFHPGVLPYWRLCGAKLAFDIEMPAEGHLQLNLQGSNLQRGTESEKLRKGEWNRLTNNTDIGTDVTGKADFGDMKEVTGNDNLYHYEADLSNWVLNTAESACGDETAKIVFFHSVTGGSFKLTNIHWIYKEVDDSDKIDLANATIAEIGDVPFYGLPVKPDPTVTLNDVTLTKGEHIIYDYSNNDAVGTATLRIIPSGKGADFYKGEKTVTFNVVSGDVVRGEPFSVAADWSKDITAVQLTKTMYLDVKFTSSDSTHINVMLGDGWDHYFGYYSLSPLSESNPFTGITTTHLDDGYIRFTFKLSELNKPDQTVGGDKSAIKKINLIYIRGAWSDASGYIDYSVETGPVDEHRGTLVTGSSHNPISCYPYQVSEGGTLTVDYVFANPSTASDQGISMYLGTDRQHCFGAFRMFKDRLDTTPDGVSFETLEDGYNRINIKVDELTNVHKNSEGAPTVIDSIMFDYFEASDGGYFDINPEGNGKEVVLKMTDDDFKIADFTDIHLQNAADIETSSSVRKTIEYGMNNSHPDAVVFTGDFVHSSNVGLVDSLCNFMDTFEVPYFFVFGNHDRENIDAAEIAEHIWQSEYGYIDLGPASLNKGGNYVVKIENSAGDLVQGLIMMDTKNKIANDESLIEYVTNPVDGVKYGTHNGEKVYCDDGWDGVRGAQIDWYKEQVTALGCETTVFMHAGMVEYTKAYENYRTAVINGDQAAIDACAPVGHCNMGEQCCGPCANYGFFAAIKEMNSTKNVICGHDHINDFSLVYQGVRLSYALKTGNKAYGGESYRSGYSLLTVVNGGATTFNQIYFDYTA